MTLGLHMLCLPTFALMAVLTVYETIECLTTMRKELWKMLKACQIAVQGMMTVMATGFLPSSSLVIEMMMVILESSNWLGKIIVRSTGKKNFRKTWIGALAAAISLEYCCKRRLNQSINQ